MNTQAGIDLKVILTKFTEPDFLDQIVTKFDQIFNDMDFIGQFVFAKYHKFVADVKSFKTSLLEFVLDAQTHLSVLKDNLASERFQQLNEEKKLKFIHARLSRINKELLLKYIDSCKQLIATSIALHDEYDTKMFKVKFVLLNLLGFTAIGAAAGFAIGLVLPFISIIEAGAGALIGAIGGLGYVIYQLAFKWNERMKEVQIVRDNLKEIHDCLVDVEKQLQTTYKEVNRSQLELNDQIKQESLLEIQDLQKYISSTYDQFIKLENILLHVKFPEKND